MNNILDILDKHYDEMFHELCQLNDDDLYEFKITVKLTKDGTEVTRSWLKRDYMLKKTHET